MSDSQIWLRIMDHDKEALAYFFRKYYSFLYNYGIKLSKNEELVEDTIQDIYYRMWTKKETLAAVGNPKSYIARSFRNALFDKLKKHHPVEPFTEFTIEPWSASHLDILLENEQEEELQRKINQSIQLLPPRQKEVIYLRFYRDLDYMEIAEILGINYQSVRNSVHAAIKTMRQGFISVLVFMASNFF